MNMEYFGDSFHINGIKVYIIIAKHFFLVDLLMLIQIDLLHSF